MIEPLQHRRSSTLPSGSWAGAPMAFTRSRPLSSPSPSRIGYLGRTCGGAWNFSCDDPTVPSDDDGNLVVRAAHLFLRRHRPAAEFTFASISMKAHSRTARALAAAAAMPRLTLRLLDQFLRHRAPARDQLMRLAAELGSDVPVFVECPPRLVPRPRRNPVQACRFPVDRLPVLLLKPPFGVSNPMGLHALERLACALKGVRYELAESSPGVPA